MVLALPPLTTPAAGDLLGLMPELVLGGAFLVLMLFDVLIPPSRRGWLAGFAFLAISAAFGTAVWGWFDPAVGRTVYFDSFAYDRFSLFIDMILLASAGVVVLISPGYLNRRGINFGEYYSLIVAATVGMMLLAGAASLMVIFLGIELLSIALYILSGFNRGDEHSQEAGVKYLLLGGFASGFLLYGMALIYGETGHTQLALIGAAVRAGGGTVDPLLLAGIILLFAGLAFKVSAAPFHWWTPDVYQGAPTVVTAFMSVTTKVAAFAAMVRVLTYTFFPNEFSTRWKLFVALVAIFSMVLGNLAALAQTSIKRMLAYSGIAQAGYILIGVAVLDQQATVAVLFYLAAYAATNLGAFAVIAVVAGRGDDLDSYESIRGLAFRRPHAAIAMSLFLFSLAGFPFTAGFIAKFLVFSVAIKAGQTQLALWGIATTAISLGYYLRVAGLMYSRPPAGGEAYEWSRPSPAGGAALVLTGVGTIIFGVFVSLLYTVADSASRGLFVGSGTGPFGSG